MPDDSGANLVRHAAQACINPCRQGPRTFRLVRRKERDMTADKFRRLALDLSGVSEREHMNHPDFRVGGKIIATLGYPDEGWGMVKLTPEQQRTFVTKAPDAFRPCNGTWGERGATNVRLEVAKLAIVRAALDAARRNVVAKHEAVDESTGHKLVRPPAAATNRKSAAAGRPVH